MNIPQKRPFFRRINWTAVLALAVSAWTIPATEASAQQIVGSTSIAGVEVQPPATTVRNVTLQAGTVDEISFDINAEHFPISWGSETRIRVVAPGGEERTYSGGDFGWTNGSGTFSFNGTLSFPAASSGGNWTLEFTDTFNDGPLTDHSFGAGSIITFVGTETVRPNVAITSTASGLTNTSPIPIMVTFDETVTGFEASDIVTTNGTVANFAGSGSTYTFDLLASGDGTVTVDVPADAAQDPSGNANFVAPQFSIEFDATAAGLDIGGMPAVRQSDGPMDVTFTFAEGVTGFEEADITITGATLSGFMAVSASVYTATVTPIDAQDVTITVAPAAALDTAGNQSAGAVATSTFATGAVANEEIAYFMENRAHALIDAQPNLTGFLTGQAGGTFDATVTQGGMNLDFASGARGSVWSTLKASRSETETHDLGYAHLSLGAHIYRTDTLIIGGMLQIDAAEQTSEDGVETKGAGGLIGPYVVSQLGDQPLFLEGRLLYGASENEVSPLGTYTDKFTTDRWLANVGITGEYETRGVTLFPNLNVTRTKDEQRSFTDSFDNEVAAQSVTLTHVDLGLDFERPFAVSGGDLFLTGGLARAWTSTEGSGPAADFIDVGERWDSRVDLGLRFDGDAGLTMSTAAYLTGFDKNSPREAFGTEFKFEYRF